MRKFVYRKRAFLAPISTGLTSYILAEAACSDEGRYKTGNYMITIADCRRCIELEFFLGSTTARRQSLAKIDLLIEILSGFRMALRNEAQLLTVHERKAKSTPRKLKAARQID